jgi:transposase InsO family protein
LYGGQKVAIFHVIDNFSRKLLASVALASASAAQCLAVLVQVVQENAVLLQKPFTLLTDAGSENKGDFDQWALQFPDLVRKLIAMQHITFSNSMAEVAHHIMKGDYIRDHVFHTIEALQAFLDRSRADYNARPAAVHDGLSANAVFAGARPVLGRYKVETRAARAARVSENQKIDCSACAATSPPA